MKDLLICIAHHYSPERKKYLVQVIENIINEYKCDFDLLIDSNKSIDYLEGIKFKCPIAAEIHSDLEHPFHLTWCHRQHIKDNIDNYKNFMYIEDDMWIPYANYLNYLENFKLLWPSYVPSFIRIEEKDGVHYVSDVRQKHKPFFINKAGKQFCSFKFPENYHASWIMPQNELKQSIKSDFVRYNYGREFAAMYPDWELQKISLLEIDNFKISNKCYSYHLPNNYAGGLATIKSNEIFYE